MGQDLLELCSRKKKKERLAQPKDSSLVDSNSEEAEEKQQKQESNGDGRWADLGLGKGQKSKRPGRWTWKGPPWKDCTLLGKVEQTRSESQHREGVRIPLPGLSQACLSSDVCPEMGPILGQPPFSLVAMDWGEHVRDDGACIVGEGAPVRSGEHWK